MAADARRLGCPGPRSRTRRRMRLGTGRRVRGDVGQLGRLGLEPGYSLLYDFGCIHGLPNSARTGAAAGLTELAAPGATLLLLAFKAGRRMVLPRGMDKDDIVGL